MSEPRALLDDLATAKLVFAARVKHLGVEVLVNQAEIDEVSFNRITEYVSVSCGQISSSYTERTRQ